MSGTSTHEHGSFDARASHQTSAGVRREAQDTLDTRGSDIKVDSSREYLSSRALSSADRGRMLPGMHASSSESRMDADEHACLNSAASHVYQATISRLSPSDESAEFPKETSLSSYKYGSKERAVATVSRMGSTYVSENSNNMQEMYDTSSESQHLRHSRVSVDHVVQDAHRRDVRGDGHAVQSASTACAWEIPWSDDDISWRQKQPIRTARDSHTGVRSKQGAAEFFPHALQHAGGEERVPPPERDKEAMGNNDAVVHHESAPSVQAQRLRSLSSPRHVRTDTAVVETSRNKNHTQSGFCAGDGEATADKAATPMPMSWSIPATTTKAPTTSRQKAFLSPSPHTRAATSGSSGAAAATMWTVKVNSQPSTPQHRVSRSPSIRTDNKTKQRSVSADGSKHRPASAASWTVEITNNKPVPRRKASLSPHPRMTGDSRPIKSAPFSPYDAPGNRQTDSNENRRTCVSAPPRNKRRSSVSPMLLQSRAEAPVSSASTTEHTKPSPSKQRTEMYDEATKRQRSLEARERVEMLREERNERIRMRSELERLKREAAAAQRAQIKKDKSANQGGSGDANGQGREPRDDLRGSDAHVHAHTRCNVKKQDQIQVELPHVNKTNEPRLREYEDSRGCDGQAWHDSRAVTLLHDVRESLPVHAHVMLREDAGDCDIFVRESRHHDDEREEHARDHARHETDRRTRGYALGGLSPRQSVSTASASAHTAYASRQGVSISWREASSERPKPRTWTRSDDSSVHGARESPEADEDERDTRLHAERDDRHQPSSLQVCLSSCTCICVRACVCEIIAVSQLSSRSDQVPAHVCVCVCVCAHICISF
jgi:hypothetical protein